ncbi:hypothetical protein [Aporhodopirellula aestuarii]|uniref:Doubled CXXCH motif (Paired_CXXCH_1) n=1 Tax=Aporhodopirellula aestuarii TaxID=2950107 RepID=A0ABT0U463_9BACT|nr:hypothetical protein [Aporhodopirellula aestuarii]MCM2371719.1 hypothetical protein [Aporhodopirellula aestuarii]
MKRSPQRDHVELPAAPRVQHPGHPFQCGRGYGDESAFGSSAASPCEQGPSASGECPLTRVCAKSGSASASPNRQRSAESLTPCRPIPTWAGSRRRWTVGSLLVFAFALIGIFGTPLAPEFVRPGNLSTSHAQILKGDLTSGGCTVCHGNVSADAWMAMRESGHVGTESTLTMSDRCVACHHDRIPTELATSAHNLASETRIAIGKQRRDILLASSHNVGASRPASNSGGSIWLPPAAISQDNVACSVCHQEHHGADADIKAIADTRCQSCHSQRFGSFATSHPEFNNWPTTSQHAIAFDHSRHANIHYPKTAESATADSSAAASQFDCRACHIVDRPRAGMASKTALADSIVSTLPFEVACASCHDETLGVQIANGPALIELPILPPEIAQQIESWPADATGSPDGKLSAWMLLLLRDQDPNVDFSPLADLSRVDWQSPQNRELAVRLGRAVRQFAIALSLDGQSFLLSAAERAGADTPVAKAFAASFPTQVMRDAASDWFGKPIAKSNDRFSARNTADEPASIDGVLRSRDEDVLVDWSASQDEDLLLSDSALPDAFTPSNIGPPNRGGHPGDNAITQPPVNWENELSKRFDAARSQSLGGWYRDDLTLSIRYHGSGHSDAVLRSLIEMAATSHGELRSMVGAQPAVAACVSCHSQLPWRAAPSNTLRDRLTRFSHRPHLDIVALQNCEHCHAMPAADSPSEVESSIALLRPNSHSHVTSLQHAMGVVSNVSAKPETDTSPADHSVTQGDSTPHGHSDFLPLKKAACAHCHTANAAGDHCTTCHRYHVGDVSSHPTTVAPIQPVR